jgi:metallo-beta-lactamase family protein
MKITFFGATREVTGSKHILTTEKGTRILLDCGLFQGKGLETDSMNRNMPFDAKSIDFLILSHAHIDHSGAIPFLVKNGFKGTIFCTNATRDLCSILLADCGKIQEMDTKTNNKKRGKQGLSPLEPLYTLADAQKSMNHFASISYNFDFRINDEVSVNFTDTGHILGAAAVNLKITENGVEKTLCYTSDIGRYENAIIRDPEPFLQADYIITESTYGDRLHDNKTDSQDKLAEIVRNTCSVKRGKLIIPSFSVGRTQEIVYALHKLQHIGKMPKVNVYVDSPLSVNATNIMRMHPECFNQEIREMMMDDPDPFGFNNLFYIQSVEDSKRLNSTNDPCIIISSSGMMEAGRVKHHLANNISNPRTTILIVGYCEPRTLGAKIKRGEKEVSIFGTVYKVKADVEVLESYSAHGDYFEMIKYLNCQDKSKIKQIFLVHGEYDVQQKYKATLENNRFRNIEIPEVGQTFEL